MHQETQPHALQGRLGPLGVHHHLEKIARHQHGHGAGDEDQGLVELAAPHGPVRQDRGECDAQGVLQDHVIGKKDPVVAEGVPEALGDHLIGEQTHVIGQPHVLPDARRALIQGQAHRVQHGISHENHIKSQRGKHVAHPVDTAGLDAFAAAEGLDPPV